MAFWHASADTGARAQYFYYFFQSSAAKNSDDTARVPTYRYARVSYVACYVKIEMTNAGDITLIYDFCFYG